MRGEFAAIARSRAAVAHLPLISQRAGPLTASPEGEAFLTHKKSRRRFLQRLLLCIIALPAA